MSDNDAITRMVEQQIARTVNDQVLSVLTADEWIEPLEQKILQYTQDRILNKFANSTAMPEIILAVKDSVSKLFAEGNIPGIDQFVDLAVIKLTVNQAVEQFVQLRIKQLAQDPDWQAQVERLINQCVVQETLSRLGSIDLGPTIKQHVEDHMNKFTDSILKNFCSTGISDLASKIELTVMDQTVVVENCLTANSLQVMDSAQVQNLVVTGSINTDNQAWEALSASITQRTLDQLSSEWKKTLIEQVAEHIQNQGIEFENVKIDGYKLVESGQLSPAVTQSKLQSLGILKSLQVRGEANFNNNTLNVLNKRLGINTDAPEKALSIWDEEVSIVIGKQKLNTAFIGTSRGQAISIGINNESQIEISVDGVTSVKRLQIGSHKISHATQVPGWSGTRGDIVFNSNPGGDRVFAWVCLGAHRWQSLKSAE